jgi:hypothetical protein
MLTLDQTPLHFLHSEEKSSLKLWFLKEQTPPSFICLMGQSCSIIPYYYLLSQMVSYKWLKVYCLSLNMQNIPISPQNLGLTYKSMDKQIKCPRCRITQPSNQTFHITHYSQNSSKHTAYSQTDLLHQDSIKHCPLNASRSVRHTLSFNWWFQLAWSPCFLQSASNGKFMTGNS